MACFSRLLSIQAQLENTKKLAQLTANLTKETQYVHEVYCAGKKIYKYSSSNKGTIVAVLQPVVEHTDVSVLQDSAKPSTRTSSKQKKEENLTD